MCGGGCIIFYVGFLTLPLLGLFFVSRPITALYANFPDFYSELTNFLLPRVVSRVPVRIWGRGVGLGWGRMGGMDAFLDLREKLC